MLIKAFIIAARAHKGQKDKGGKAYIFHPLHVAMHTKGRKEKAVALLHDVIEDTNITADDLKNKGFSNEIIKAVEAITKIRGEAYEVYLNRVKSDRIARAVKIADLQHNSDLSRLKTITERDKQRQARYKRSIEFLLA